ncbi:PqqD family peptide modification chaperone [candidate division WOR-3 bacterium]|nr:PqqD family peptide modification chaperone [candidate division WOR-3 bacterium]
MLPLLKTSDVLTAVRTTEDDLKKGEIVVFERGERLVAHTIVKTRREKKKMMVLTKGLNKDKTDGWVESEKIKFKVVAVVKDDRIKYLSRAEKILFYYYSFFRKKIRNFMFNLSVKISPLIKFLIGSKIIKIERLKLEDEEVYLLFKRKIYEKNKDMERFHPFIGKSVLSGEDIVQSSEFKGKPGGVILDPDIVFRTEGDEGLVYNVKTGDFRILNETGCSVLKYADGNNTREEILKKMSLEYEAENSGEMEKEIEDFVDNLLKKGIIKCIP